MIRCSACGALHPVNTLYCDECGSRLASARAPAAQTTADQVQEGDVPLTVALRTLDGETHFSVVLDKQALIGRPDDALGAKPAVNLDLLDGKHNGVSRRHARLLREGAQVMLEDLNSLNGTFVQGVRLAANAPQAVQADDKLQFGKIVLRIEF